MPAIIPVIDIAPFVEGRQNGQAAVDQLASAAEGSGFFLVTGHGVNEETIRSLYNAARAFFDRPDKDMGDGGQTVMGGLSFSPIGSEALAATQGDKGPGDLKQSLNYGARLPGAAWPANEAALQDAVLAYFAEMEALSKSLRRMFCAAIGLPQDHFEPAFREHLSALRVIDYPEQKESPLPGQVRAGAHTDYGFMTILRSEATPGGLQVSNLDGTWVDVPAVEDGFVVNIGDAFMRWSNDRWKSTPHRVVNPPVRAKGPTRRQSIPFFVNPSADTMIECLDAFKGDGARYDPVRYDQWIAHKTQQAFGTN